MANFFKILFPVAFGFFSMGIFWIFSRFSWNREDPLLMILVFLSAMGWSSLIEFRKRNHMTAKIILVILSILGSIAAVERIFPHVENIFIYRTIYALTTIGILLILFYFFTLQRKGE